MSPDGFELLGKLDGEKCYDSFAVGGLRLPDRPEQPEVDAVFPRLESREGNPLRTFLAEGDDLREVAVLPAGEVRLLPFGPGLLKGVRLDLLADVFLEDMDVPSRDNFFPFVVDYGEPHL